MDRLLKTELTHKSKMSQRDRLKKFIKKTDQRTQKHSESMHDRNGSEQKSVWFHSMLGAVICLCQILSKNDARQQNIVICGFRMFAANYTVKWLQQ